MTTAQNLVVIGVERLGREGPPMTKIVMSAFSYGSLEQGVAETAREAATEIKATERNMCDGAIAIGRRLLRVKEILPRGEFGKWIDSEFDWGERTAQNYMRLTDAFGENAQRIADLPLRSLYALATQPAATRERVLDLVDKGERPAEQDHHLHHPSCQRRTSASRSRRTRKSAHRQNDGRRARARRPEPPVTQEAEGKLGGKEGTGACGMGEGAADKESCHA